MFIYVYIESQVVKRAIHLFDNSAEYGGAIYVADDTIIGTCSSGTWNTVTAILQSECFIQVIGVKNESYTFRPDAVSFANNTIL